MSIAIDNKIMPISVSLPNEKSQSIEAKEIKEASDRSIISKEELDKALEKINTFLEDNDTYAEYEMHDKFNHIMIRIVDRNTREVVLEIPPKKILDIVSRMCELVGVLVDKKA